MRFALEAYVQYQYAFQYSLLAGPLAKGNKIESLHLPGGLAF